MKGRTLSGAAAALLLAIAAAPIAAAGDQAAAGEAARARRAAEAEARRQAIATAPRPAAAALHRFTSPTLTPFADDGEFEAYVRALRAAAREDREIRERAWRGSALARPIRFAQAASGSAQATTDAQQQPVCAPDEEPCEEAGEASIMVTGSRITARNASITNNQMRGVDEGDIVKQIGRHLLVLSDGRIFVIDTRPGGRPGLALVDRVDVYRDRFVDTWYDEMLVFDDRILVAGYSYDEGETELASFRIDAAGQLTREGVFTRQSNDYYSSSNYATRVVGDSLVLYSLFDIDELDEDGRFGLASMQQWVREPEDAPRLTRRRRWNDPDEVRPVPTGPRLLDANSVYRPVRTELDPTLHAISICPLTVDVRAAASLPCRSTAFVGPQVAQWYVTAEETVLWGADEHLEWDRECAGGPTPLGQVVPAILFRIPHDRSGPGVAAARGVPFDQFSMQVDAGRLRALVDRRPACDDDRDAAEPLYVETPLSVFGPVLREIGERSYAAVPNPGTRWIANRFTERHLVYGGLSQYRRGLPDVDWDDYDDPQSREWMRRRLARPPAYVVPAGRPGDVSRLDIGHTVIRAERYGDNDVVLTGYRDRRGLSVSLIDLDGRPRIGSTLELEGRFESEGRSHAYNSLVEASGAGLIGLPTSPRQRDSRRSPSYSRASDISFISVDAGHLLADNGQLTSRLVYAQPRYNSAHDDEADEDGLEGYECEVSCIDWYGNSRPIFTDGRIFALMGGELVEGRRGTDRIIEVRRLDFLRTPPRR